MAANPLPEWLDEVAADEVVVCPDDIIAEARGNLWTFGLDHEQRAAVSAAEVEAFVLAVATARGEWLARRGAGPMQFYCWHDNQAGQLRFSLVSVGKSLPFGCSIELVSVLGTVVREFLEPDRLPTPLPVWVAVVPAAPDAEPTAAH